MHILERLIGLAIVGVAFAMSAVAQHSPPPSAPVPESLQLSRRAPLHDPGLATAPAPNRQNAREPFTALGFICRACERSGNQTPDPSQAGWGRAQLLGSDRRVVEPWLRGISGIDPIVINTKHASLVACLEKARAADVSPDETARLRAVFPDLDPVIVTLSGHQLAHLWAERLLRIEASLGDILELPGSVWADPHLLATPSSAQLFLFTTNDAAAPFIAQRLSPDTWALGGALSASGPAAAVVTGAGDQAEVRRAFEWCAARALARMLAPIDDAALPGWLVSGLTDVAVGGAARAPAALSNPATYAPGTTLPADQERALLDRAASGRLATIGGLSQIPLRALSPTTRTEAWSLVRFLLVLDRDRLAQLVDVLARTPGGGPCPKVLTDAVRRVYGHDAVTIETAWKAWVPRK